METNKTKEIIVGVILAAVLIGGIYFSLQSYKAETERMPKIDIDNDNTATDYIDTKMQITSIDANKGDVNVRITFQPHGSFSEDSLTLSKEVTLYTNSNSGKNEHIFAKGKRMNPVDVVIDMREGVVTDYPYDSFIASLDMYMTTPSKTDSGATEPLAIVMDKEIEFYSSIQGYKVTDVVEDNDGDGFTGIDFALSRTSSVKFFSTFIMVTMWIISLAVLFVMLSIILRNRKVEYSMFAFLSAMLFAFPAMRNVQPFVPPIGCLSDYIAFFWAEGIIALSLIIMIITWLKRTAARHS